MTSTSAVRITPDDLDEIEKRMKKLIKANDRFERSEMSVDEALAYYADKDQPYKVELIEDLAARGETSVSFYKNGEFVDLCAGPHVPRTGNCKAFKLLKVAGAYWRGDSDRPMLQRIYGTAWKNKTDLNAYLEMLEEAKKRDHRKLGNEPRPLQLRPPLARLHLLAPARLAGLPRAAGLLARAARRARVRRDPQPADLQQVAL